MSDTFDKAIAELAEAIAEKASEDATPLAEKIDALGKLTSYYGLYLKNKGKIPADDEEPTMDDFAQRLRTAEENGDGRSEAVSNRRGARRTSSTSN